VLGALRQLARSPELQAAWMMNALPSGDDSQGAVEVTLSAERRRVIKARLANPRACGSAPRIAWW
jgi:hypothetical protein